MPGSRNADDSLKKQAPTDRSGAKKDRKRWCKGKAGREHDYQVQVRPNVWGDLERIGERCQPHNWSDRYDWWICKHCLVCQNCGRQEDITKEQCPDWKAN